MERLTKKFKGDLWGMSEQAIKNGYGIIEAFKKLGELEDIEEKCSYNLGIAINELSGEILRLKDENAILKNKLIDNELMKEG